MSRRCQRPIANLSLVLADVALVLTDVAFLLAVVAVVQSFVAFAAADGRRRRFDGSFADFAVVQSDESELFADVAGTTWDFNYIFTSCVQFRCYSCARSVRGGIVVCCSINYYSMLFYYITALFWCNDQHESYQATNSTSPKKVLENRNVCGH